MQVQVINLNRDAKKWTTIQETFRNTSYQLKRFPAIDGHTRTYRNWYMTGAMTGCLESHKALWRQCVQQNKPMLIFEDDCEPMPHDFHDLSIFKTLPADYDVALLGYLFDDRHFLPNIARPLLQRRRSRSINHHWRIPGYFTGSHAYLVSVKGALKLLQSKTQFHIDAIISTMPDFKLYALSKCRFKQRQPGQIRIANTTLEWLLSEPVFALCGCRVRVIHIALACIMTCYLVSRK